MAHEKQQQIDFDRATQLALLRDLVLPPSIGAAKQRVSAASLKAVLRAIDDFGRGREAWPSVETIANGTGLGKRTVMRAIHALQHDLGLLIVTRRKNRRGTSSNHYRIVWSEVAIRRQRQDQGAAAAPYQSAAVTDQSAAVTDQSAAVTDQSAAVTPESLRSDQKRKEASPPSSPSPAAGTLDDGWEEAEALLAEVGMGRRSEAITAAQTQGLAADQVLAIVAHWRDSRPRERWKSPIGVLYDRLATGSPAWPPTEHWPPAQPGFHATAASSQRREQTAQRAAAAACQLQSDEEREARFGPLLDAMPAAERDRFAERTLGSAILIHYRRFPAGFARMILLQQLEKEQAHEFHNC